MASAVAEDVEVVNEQFRKTASAVAEQTRQAVNSVQEQFQQNLNQAQQAQSDLARKAVRLNEQNSQLFSAAFAGFWDTSTAALKLAAWGQEQVERGARELLEQRRVSRAEGVALA